LGQKNKREREMHKTYAVNHCLTAGCMALQKYFVFKANRTKKIKKKQNIKVGFD
jgi:invasion protein IalB